MTRRDLIWPGTVHDITAGLLPHPLTGGRNMFRLAFAVLVLAAFAVPSPLGNPIASQFPARTNLAPRVLLAQQNKNICYCWTYSNSVCSGPCTPSGLPEGCLCNQMRR